MSRSQLEEASAVACISDNATANESSQGQVSPPFLRGIFILSSHEVGYSTELSPRVNQPFVDIRRVRDVFDPFVVGVHDGLFFPQR